MKKYNKTIKDVWHFLWESDSILSWLVNIVLAFLIIKFIVYPSVGLVLGTSYPMVAVVSGSMEHMVITHNNTEKPNICGISYDKPDYFISFNEYWDICGKWYEKRENKITKEGFSKYLFKEGFNKGDIIFIYGENPKNLKIGDIIVFNRNKQYPIIHRIVEIREINGKRYFTTKGDHNSGSHIMLDQNISEDMILGKAVLRVPYLGWAKIWFVDLINFIKR